MSGKAIVLVIDDEEGMRDFLAFALQTEGYQVLTAAGGQEALRLMERDNIDAILTDLKMPGMDGIELLRRIREYDRNAIVVIMTAYASLQSALEAMKYGAYDYLIKPFDDIDTVMNAVARAVERRRLAQRNARLLEDLERANQQLSQMYENAQHEAVELRQSYEELKALDELEGQFMTRTFRALLESLTHVKGRLALLTSERIGPLSDEQKRELHFTEQRADELIRLVNDVLCLQESETERVRLAMHPVSLAAVVEQACHQIQPKADEKAITVDWDLPEGLPLILGDEARLQQAVMHLLDNAVKFSPPFGRVNVSLQQEGNQVRLIVSDQGEGIPAEKIQHLFDYLHRADSSRQRAAGLGLGLAVVKRIVDAHGGAIEVASRAGRGMAITLILPSAVPDD
ncbi:MAG: response regulator [Anaerolineae bacterium]|jgi:signal transduction histidine kinase|nr:response regulator [Anaerolineae bacterium]MDH7473877.1 response regulator [Anaerolineae bacterium]